MATGILANIVLAAALAQPAAPGGAAPGKADMSRPYSTIAAVQKAIDEGETVPGDIVFLAALCADWTGDPVRSRDFLSYYVDHEKGNGTGVRRALVRLCRDGAEPARYARYLEAAPHDMDALNLGLYMLGAFLRERRVREFAELAEMLVGAWPKGEEFSEIALALSYAVHQSNVPGISDGRAVLGVLSRNAEWEVNYPMRDFLSRCAQRRFSHVEWKAVDDAVKSGRHPDRTQPGKASGGARALQWVADEKAGKYKGRPVEALKAAAAVFDGASPAEFSDVQCFSEFLPALLRIAGEDPKVAEHYPFKGASKAVFGRIRPGMDADMRVHGYGSVLAAYAAAGRLAEGLERVEKAADACGGATGAASFRLAAVNTALDPRDGKPILHVAWWDMKENRLRVPDPARDRLAWTRRLVAKVEKAQVPELSFIPFDCGVNNDAYWRCQAAADAAKRPLTEAERSYRAAVVDFCDATAQSAYPNGFRRLAVRNGRSSDNVTGALLRALQADPGDRRVVRCAASTALLGNSTWQVCYAAATNLLAHGSAELAYMIASRHWEFARQPSLQRVRAAAAAQMPGLYPVQASDPAYPLFVAAEALARGNAERAWKLLSGNRAVFDKDPMRFPPPFVLWALDQYIRAGGANGPLADAALKHAESMLQKEESLPPEVAAGLLLLRAETARARMQFESAHAGYQTLRNHQRYRGTQAARRAMFRDASLQLETGAVDAAAQAAEQWAVSPEDDVRAQGHYLLAKIAFRRKDYDTTREQLEKTFEIDLTHAEARLLQGEWKLATNYEVDETQVLLGDLSDRSSIRPGQPLMLTVKDRNLALAGGGASIPVVVQTTGGDAEKVLLYPGTRDPSLFRGVIDTVPGLARAKSGVLELAGDDEVSYAVEEEFLRARGVASTAPRRLAVVDDARLEVGTGSELRTVRPGQDIPVRLTDRDRSRRAGGAAVSVSLRTSSGDRIASFPLAETATCSGVFEGTVKTALPPPRAFASDSAAGCGPQDLISSSRNGVWRSLEDGRKPKHVGVDLMDSRLVKTAALVMPEPAVVKTVRLYGKLDGDEFEIPGDACRIKRDATGFKASFDKAMRLRALRWEFADFAGRGVSVSKMHVNADDNRTLIPTARDFSQAQENDVLEIAPGDMVTVSYEDEVTTSGRARVVEETLKASFSTGVVSFKAEENRLDRYGKSATVMFDAYRVAPGDAVWVCIADADLDVSRGADSVKVKVTADDGASVVLQARERETSGADGEKYVSPRDSGVFWALVRTVPKKGGGEKTASDTLALGPGEGLSAVYEDRENLDPGVPVERRARLSGVKGGGSELVLAHTREDWGADASPEGALRLAAVRRRAESLRATEVWRPERRAEWAGKGETAVVTPVFAVPVSLKAPAEARHSGSTAKVRVARKSDLEASGEDGAAWSEWTLSLGKRPATAKFPAEAAAKQKGKSSGERAEVPSVFYGEIDLVSSSVLDREASALDDEEEDFEEGSPRPVDLRPGDELVVRYVGGDGGTCEARAAIGTTGWMALADVTYEAANPSVHLGEAFHVLVRDADRDVSDEEDEIEVKVKAKGGAESVCLLRETMPRSGVFTAPFAVLASLPAAAEGAAGIAASPGDVVGFAYRDESVSRGDGPGTRHAEGTVLPGSDGSMRVYSKRFRDADQAILVQFRLAECLFEMAKDYRRLKDGEKSAAAIADGRRILEAALRDYPGTSRAAEGEFLLANLSEQLAEESRKARKAREEAGEDLSKEPDEAAQLYRDAIARFSAILSAWPEGDCAARSQFHKAFCLERLGDFARACEEYVKITYQFPDSPLVGDASVRLASHYYAREKRYDIAGRIYRAFRDRFPSHEKAPEALFMAGQCHIKRAEELAGEEKPNNALVRAAYAAAVPCFVALVDSYRDAAKKELLAQALYWAGDVSFRMRDYPNAYIYLKRTTFEYPESQWARRARGLLLEQAEAFNEVAE